MQSPLILAARLAGLASLTALACILAFQAGPAGMPGGVASSGGQVAAASCQAWARDTGAQGRIQYDSGAPWCFASLAPMFCQLAGQEQPGLVRRQQVRAGGGGEWIDAAEARYVRSGEALIPFAAARQAAAYAAAHGGVVLDYGQLLRHCTPRLAAGQAVGETLPALVTMVYPA
jgi:nitrous oxide reductase accessory protein NosL